VHRQRSAIGIFYWASAGVGDVNVAKQHTYCTGGKKLFGEARCGKIWREGWSGEMAGSQRSSPVRGVRAY